VATWQFDTVLIPRKRVVELFLIIPETVSNEEYLANRWWLSENSTSESLIRLDSFLPRRPSWDNGIVAWGDEDGNRVDLVLSQGIIEEVYVRFDVKDLGGSFLPRVVDLAKSMDLIFLGLESRRLIEPNRPDLIYEIRGSRAFKFVEDPIRFFRGLKGARPRGRFNRS